MAASLSRPQCINKSKQSRPCMRYRAVATSARVLTSWPLHVMHVLTRWIFHTGWNVHTFWCWKYSTRVGMYTISRSIKLPFEENRSIISVAPACQLYLGGINIGHFNVNPCWAEFLFMETFIAFLDTELAQVIAIFPHERQEFVYPTESIIQWLSGVLATLGAKVLAPQYWPSHP